MYGIAVRGIHKKYSGGHSLFNGITFTCSTGDKTVLVGENGAGKSTLLRILAGIESPDKGTLNFDEWVVRRYVAQDFIGRGDLTVAQYVADVDAGIVRRLLGELDFPKTCWGLPMRLLSGGQKRIVELAKTFAEEPDFLFLDEPENHLDYVAREWLIRQVQAANTMAVCIVSHDQFIIDQVANTIVELEDGDLEVFPGSYQAYLDERRRRLEGEQRDWRQRKLEIDRHEKMVVMLRQRARRSDGFAKTYRSKARQLAKMKSAQTSRPQLERKAIKLSAGDVDRKARKRIVTLTNLSLSLGKTQLFSNVDLELVFGEKVCLFGRNGTGKSSLFRLIQREIKPTGGDVRIGNDIRIGYFSQEHEGVLDPNRTPIEELQAHYSESEGKVRSALSKFLYTQDAMSRRIATLSGGQKTRLRFAKLFHGRPELLLLDEPTNHLDRSSWEVLTQALKDFNGTVLMVSHDRTFVDEIAEKLWVFDGESVYEHLGNLSDYLDDE